MKLKDIRKTSSEDLALMYQDLASDVDGKVSRRDILTRDQIWQEIQSRYLPLMLNAAGRVASFSANSSTLSREDSLQEASVGLLEAIQRYQRKDNVTFGAYARMRVKGAVMQHTRDNVHAVSILKTKKSRRIVKFIKENIHLEFDELVKVGSEKFDISSYDFTLFYNAATQSSDKNCVSVATETSDENATPDGLLIADKRESGEARLQHEQLREKLRVCIEDYFSNFDPLYLEIFKKRLGLDDSLDFGSAAVNCQEISEALKAEGIELSVYAVRKLFAETNENLAKLLVAGMGVNASGGIHGVLEDISD